MYDYQKLISEIRQVNANPANPGNLTMMRPDAGNAALKGLYELADTAKDISAQYRDPNSVLNKNMMRGFLGMARRMGPSTNTLMSMNRGQGGLSMQSSGVMANQQLKEYDQRARMQAGDMFTNAYMQAQGLGANYFGNAIQATGMAGDQALKSRQLTMQQNMYDDQQQNFLGGLLGFAGNMFMPAIGQWGKDFMNQNILGA